MATSIGEIALDLVLNSDEFESRVSDIARRAATTAKKNSGLADSMNKIGGASATVGSALLGVSAPLTGLGIASTKSALTFEDSMAKVMTIADQTEVSYDDMKSSIMDLSDQTGISANEIADNVYNAISAGQKTGDAVNFVTNSTKLAKAGFAEAGASLDILTTILNAYGMEASEVTNVSDMLIQTQNKGKVTVGELSNAMGKVIPTAKAYNVSLDQLCAGYAIMTSNGVACAESTTYMNGMLNELGKAGTDVAALLIAETGQSFSELMESGMSLSDVLKIVDEGAKKSGHAFTDMWGSSEAAKAGLILLGNEGQEFNAMLGEMGECAGATDKAFETLDTTGYKMEIALNKIKNAGIQLGGTLLEMLAPVIVNVCEGISKACDWFNSLDGNVKKIIFVISGLVNAFGGGLLIFGKLATGISSVITAVQTLTPVISTVITGVQGLGPVISGLGGAFLSLNPTVLIIIGVIGALIAIGVLLYKNWDTIKEYAQVAWEAIKNIISTTLEVIKNAIVMYVEFLQTFWGTAWEVLKTVVTTVFEAIKIYITGWFEMLKTIVTTSLNVVKTYFSTIFESIKIIVENVVNTIKTIIQTVFNTIKTIISTILNGIKTVVSNIFNAIKCLIKGDIEGAKQNVIQAFNTMKNTASSVLGAMKDCIINIFNAVKSGIANTMSGVKTTVMNGLNNAFAEIKKIPAQALQWGKDMIMGIVKGIRSCIGAVGDAVKSVAEKIKSFLHFSVPDEGPLTDYESWMPDFMQGLAKGIRENKNVVGNAISDLTSLMKTDFETPELSSSMKLGFETPELRNTTRVSNNQVSTESSEMFNKLSEMFKTIMDNNFNGDITIPVYVGGNVIDEVVVKAQDRRKLRSGGMA